MAVGRAGAAASAALAALAGCASIAPAEAPPAPNVLVVLVDDLGAEAIACYGGESYSTPNVDRLAASGMRFTNAHTSPLCTPTRVRLLTGRGADRSYWDFGLLHPDERTFAHELGQAGYATVVAGKWQLYGSNAHPDITGLGQRPESAGFDAWCLWQVERLGSRYANPQVERDGELLTVEGGYGPDVYTDYLIEFLRAHREERFLAYYPMALTHDPFEPTPASVDRAGPRERNFADMVAYMDALVGRLIDELEALGLREETLVVFTTDNGSPRQITSRAWGREVRGGKKLTTDAGTHVPLIVSWPGVIEPGAVFDGLVDLYDIAPTLYDASGVGMPGYALDGRSLWPELRGLPGPVRDVVTCYYDPRPTREGWTPVRWARGPRYKLYEDGRFFDVARDRDEEKPLDTFRLTDEEASELGRLRAAMDSMPATRRSARGASLEPVTPPSVQAEARHHRSPKDDRGDQLQD